MTTTSWPAVGNNGLSAPQWARMNDSPDGIVEDYTGNSCGLTLLSTSNISRVGTGIVRVQGYYIEVTAAEDFSTPDPGTGTVTYLLAATYDPTLNVADGSGNASALGPVRITVSTNTLDTSGGKSHYVLHTVTRTAGQALSVAVTVDYRKWVGPNIEWPWSLPSAPAGSVALYPRGTMRFDKTYDRIVVRTMNAAGTALEWRPYGQQDAVAFPSATGLAAFDAPAQYWFENSTVCLRGTLKRTSGSLSTGSNVVLGSLPVTAAPLVICRFLVDSVLATSGNHYAASVKVESDGTVTLYDPTSVVQWVDLSNIRFRSRA